MKKAFCFHITTAVLILLLSVSCSSQPKDSGDIKDLRSVTEKDLDIGNKTAGRGDYGNALLLLNECKKKAIRTDDTALIVRVGLSRGNVLFSLGRNEEAFEQWDESIALAQKDENSELLSVSKIYRARGMLLSDAADAQSVHDEVKREAVNIKTDNYLYLAFSWQIRGLALRELKSYTEAENAVKRSLDIHEKNKYLENASYDWYIIASIRSLAGNAPGALQALKSAIDLDRRIENSWGIAASWRAMGDVYRKMGNDKDANEAYIRARNIYAAMENDKEAAETERRMEQ